MPIDADGGTNRATLRLEWGGEEYECRATMRTLMHIEERVTLHGLANRIVLGDGDVPVTHLAWCVYCLLKGAGARLTDEQAMEAMRDGTFPAETLADVARWLIQETYGVAPQPHEDDEDEPEGKTIA